MPNIRIGRRNILIKAWFYTGRAVTYIKLIIINVDFEAKYIKYIE